MKRGKENREEEKGIRKRKEGRGNKEEAGKRVDRK